jgi:hypothetical protein
VRTTVIVFLPPSFDQLLGLGQGFEPVDIQAFIADVDAPAHE